MPQDPRLGRLQEFDERSRAYPIMATLAAAPPSPRSYTWSCGAVLDQGMEGSCVGHAWAHELIARPAIAAGVDQPYARRLYHEAQRIDEWEGGAYDGAGTFYEGTSVLAGAKIVAGLGAMAEYRWAFSLHELAMGVGYKGPAVLGIPWHEAMSRPDADGRIRAEGEWLGGHAILARAVSVKARTFTLRNSWGPGWGRGGDAIISWDDLERLLLDGGEACIPVGRRAITAA